MFLSQGKVTLRNIGKGKYFKIVAEVYVNGKFLAKELIKRGLAVSYDGDTKVYDWCEASK